MTTVSQRWSQLESIKRPYLRRAEQYARWTLSHVFPPEDYQGEFSLDRDWDSVGAQASNHLSNKLMLTLFAPARPFFRMDADEATFVELAKELGVDEVQVKLMFSRAEKAAVKRLVSKQARTALTQLMKLLVITGNGLFYLPKEGRARTYNLHDYVVERSTSGDLQELILREEFMFSQLENDVKAQVSLSRKANEKSDKVKLYTWITREGDNYNVQQYADDIPLDGAGKFAKDKLPYIPVTWNLITGDHYGVGHVEEYQGEFHTVDVMQQSLVEGAAVAAQLKFLVNPNGSADVEELNNAENGDFVWGAPDDISTVNVDKVQDWATLQGIVSQAEQRIGRGFLVNSAITRDAERVTAEEIRLQATELENALGGVYSNLAEQLQLPIANLLIEEIDLGGLKDAGVEPTITTGIDSLSRGSEHEQMMLFLQDTAILNGIPEDVRATLNTDALLTSMAMGRGVKHEDIIKTQEQQEADRERQLAEQERILAAQQQAKQQVQ